MIGSSSRFLKKEKERKYWVRPIQKYRGRRVPPPDKDQRDYHGRFKVYSRMSVAQFDALLAILESHIKRPPISVNSVCKDLYTVLVLRDEVDELDNRHSGVRLYSGSELSKHLKMLATDAENEKKKNQTRSEFFYDRRKFQRQCVNVIDITWGCIYLSTCEHFGLGVQWPSASRRNIKTSNLWTVVYIELYKYITQVKSQNIPIWASFLGTKSSLEKLNTFSNLQYRVYLEKYWETEILTSY